MSKVCLCQCYSCLRGWHTLCDLECGRYRGPGSEGDLATLAQSGGRTIVRLAVQGEAPRVGSTVYAAYAAGESHLRTVSGSPGPTPEEQRPIGTLVTMRGDAAYVAMRCPDPPSAPPRRAPPAEPVPMILTCVSCGARHVDRGEFATKPHHTHSCQSCGVTWRPAVVCTVGVQFLPGFKDPPA